MMQTKRFSGASARLLLACSKGRQAAPTPSPFSSWRRDASTGSPRMAMPTSDYIHETSRSRVTLRLDLHYLVMSKPITRLALGAAGLLALACTGAVDGGGGGDKGPGGGPSGAPGGSPKPGMTHEPAPAPVNPAETTNLAGPRPLRRLTLFEYA